MSERNRANVRVEFGDGSKLEQFTSFRLHESFTDPLGSYSFETRPLPNSRKSYREKLKRGEKVVVRINNVSVGTFLITTSRRKYTRDGAIYAIDCKSLLATAYEGSIDPKLNLSAQTDTPISSIVLKALGPYGFTVLTGDGGANRDAVSGRDIAGKAPPILVKTLKAKELKAEDGETATGFCVRLFSRLGLALRVNAKGELVLEAPDYQQDPIDTVIAAHDTTMPGDYLLDGWEYTETNDGQFSECVVKGNPGIDDDTSTVLPYARVVTTTGEGYEASKAFADMMSTGAIKPTPYGSKRANYSSTVAPYKPLIIHDKNSRDAARAKSVALLSLGIRAKSAVTAMGEVDGMVSASGRIWSVNTVVRLVLEDEEIDEPWWVLERTFSLSKERGQTTGLTLLPLGALVLGEVPS